MCVVYDVHLYGGTGVRAFLHEPHIIFFMRCSLDIMRMCIRTSCVLEKLPFPMEGNPLYKLDCATEES